MDKRKKKGVSSAKNHSHLLKAEEGQKLNLAEHQILSLPKKNSDHSELLSVGTLQDNPGRG